MGLLRGVTNWHRFIAAPQGRKMPEFFSLKALNFLPLFTLKNRTYLGFK
jgi:hypothetical protein